MWQQLQNQILNGDSKALARTISLVENEFDGYKNFLQSLPPSSNKIIGITGPPGAGKSTLVDALIEQFVNAGQKVGVLCVDPSSPFNLGAVLGDRIRMNDWYTHPNVFIRSLASRGSMGGLHPKIIEISDLMKVFPFHHIIVETVGVGQSEVEIAGLADVTVVVLVPEVGDEVQTMKAGLMEIADVFVLNKSDRPSADLLEQRLRMMLAPSFSNRSHEIPILRTIASEKKGIIELAQTLLSQIQQTHNSEKRFWLLTERAFCLIQEGKMKNINKVKLKKEIEASYNSGCFNLYSFLADKSY